MARIAIAIDLGTSGFRAQAIDLLKKEIISTVITTSHPLPGVNVIDHVHFTLEVGLDVARSVIVQALNKVIGKLGIELNDIVRLGVCGNPVQLSLFQGIDIQDLAYPGRRKQESLGVSTNKREAAVVLAKDVPELHLPGECDVIIPPAVVHEVGADLLAMIIQTGMLRKDDISLSTDFGTNAEMALFCDGVVYTGSAAAGPALEGQHISCGMLAVPGVISDLKPEALYHRVIVLDSSMFPVDGSLIDIRDGSVIEAGKVTPPIGITGTGTIAIMNQAIQSGLITIPNIKTLDNRLHLGAEIYFTEDDLKEAGKAIGSVRAGHLTLCEKAGISMHDIEVAYMAGASGTYVDAQKAQLLGLIPPNIKKTYQVGNTSLAMARELVLDTNNLDAMINLSNKLKPSHCMFASSDVFKKIYILEISYWMEGMPMSLYRNYLKKYGLRDLLPVEIQAKNIHVSSRDIDNLGKKGLTTIHDIGQVVQLCIKGCSSCMKCISECPQNALSFIKNRAGPTIALKQSLCDGVACKRCERCCPERVFELSCFFIKKECNLETRS